MRTYLGKRGYILLKDKFTEGELEKIKEDLSVKPNVSTDYGPEPEAFKVFLENKTKLYLPKFYGLEKLGEPDENKLKSGDDIDLVFNGDLRANQLEPVNACVKAFEEKGGGILSLPCGEGKTALACYLISKMRKKTFVLVHKTFLMNQWIERILGGPDSHAFLPDAKVGKIQGPTIDIDGKDIVIGMIQSISMKNYPLDLFDSFGMVIIDEAHCTPSKEFSKALFKINCPLMLGLSATPNRKDGLTKVLKWHVGDVCFMRKGKSSADSIVERYVYQCDNQAYCEELSNYMGKINSAGMINNLSSYMPRTRFIVKKMIECVKEEKRQVLLLGDRREMLKDIENLLKETDVTYGYYVGGMKPKALEESTGKQIILATFKMADTGLDIKTVDTIVFATPKTEIEQAAGRIRPKPGVEDLNPPLIIDIVDDFSIFSAQARKRDIFYRKKKYFVETFEVSEDGDEIEKVSTYDPNEDKCMVKKKPKESVLEKNPFLSKKK